MKNETIKLKKQMQQPERKTIDKHKKTKISKKDKEAFIEDEEFKLELEKDEMIENNNNEDFLDDYVDDDYY